MIAKRQRLYLLIFSIAFAAIGLSLILWALSQNLMYFYTPSELDKADIKPNQTLRIGGLVQKNSVKLEDKNIYFTITDGQKDLAVEFKNGSLPDLFREGQGVIATGTLSIENPPQIFQATEILAKHDENYMPAGLEKKLKENGVWKGQK